MNVDLTHYVSVVVAMAALSVAVLHAVRDAMIRAALRRQQRRDGDSSRRAGELADVRDPAGGGPARKPAGGESYDPRPQEDRARRRIAYHLVAILALMVFSLLAMVAFGVIAVEDVEKFGVLVAPVVTLVTAATSSYYADRRSGK